MKILFVCTANIVRSFMAERILKGRLNKMGRTDVDVFSGAIIDMGMTPADPLAVELLHEFGFDGDSHTSKVITDEMISEAGLIAVMENVHKKVIIDTHPEAEGKIYLLKSFSRDYNEDYGDIRDPYRLSPYHYRLCFAEIFMAVEGLLKCI